MADLFKQADRHCRDCRNHVQGLPNPQCDSCSFPERTNFVTREGERLRLSEAGVAAVLDVVEGVWNGERPPLDPTGVDDYLAAEIASLLWAQGAAPGLVGERVAAGREAHAYAAWAEAPGPGTWSALCGATLARAFYPAETVGVDEARGSALIALGLEGELLVRDPRPDADEDKPVS